MSTFHPVTRARIADQVAGAIRNAILGGQYGPGERLPAERELAIQFDVNRSTVREALTRLEAWGLVEVRHGGGVTVADFLADSGLHVLPWILAPNGVPDPELMSDLLSLRVALLEFTARQAASHATPDDVAELDAALKDLDVAKTRPAVQAADFRFFEALITASGNRVLQLVSIAIGAAYHENQELFESLYPTQATSTALHHAAVAAIRSADPIGAAEAMRGYGESALEGLQK